MADNQNFEAASIKILTAALADKSVLEKVCREFEPEAFPKAHREFVAILREIGYKQRAAVTKQVLDDYLTQNPKAHEVSVAIQKTFSDCATTSCSSEESKYFLTEFKRYRADRILRNVLQAKDEDNQQILEKGKPVKSVVELLHADKDPFTAAKKLKQALVEIESLSKEDPIIRVSVRERAKDKYQEYEDKKKDSSKAIGILTGFGPLDDATLGMGEGEMFIVAARPGKGKSITMVNMAKNILKDGKSVMLMSLEMPYVQYEDRFISSYAGISNTRMRLGALTEEEEKRLKTAWEEIAAKKNEFEIVDFPNINAFQIEAELTRALDRYTPDVVIVDYIGIMKPNDKESVADWEKQGKIAEEVRTVARMFKTRVISAVQLNRSKTKDANTDRLSRSDIIGATSDCIFMINDDGDDKENISDMMKFTVIKNRKGADGFEFEMYKNLDTVTIKNPSSYKSRIEEMLKGSANASQVR